MEISIQFDWKTMTGEFQVGEYHEKFTVETNATHATIRYAEESHEHFALGDHTRWYGLENILANEILMTQKKRIFDYFVESIGKQPNLPSKDGPVTVIKSEHSRGVDSPYIVWRLWGNGRDGEVISEVLVRKEEKYRVTFRPLRLMGQRSEPPSESIYSDSKLTLEEAIQVMSNRAEAWNATLAQTASTERF